MGARLAGTPDVRCSDASASAEGAKTRGPAGAVVTSAEGTQLAHRSTAGAPTWEAGAEGPASGSEHGGRGDAGERCGERRVPPITSGPLGEATSMGTGSAGTGPAAAGTGTGARMGSAVYTGEPSWPGGASNSSYSMSVPQSAQSCRSGSWTGTPTAGEASRGARSAQRARKKAQGPPLAQGPLSPSGTTERRPPGTMARRRKSTRAGRPTSPGARNQWRPCGRSIAPPTSCGPTSPAR